MIGGHKKKVRALTASLAEHQSLNEQVTRELYKKNLELAHTNRTLTLLRRIDELVLQANSSLNNLAKGVSEAVIESSTYSMCGMFIGGSHIKQTPFYLKGYALVGMQATETVDTQLKNARFNASTPFFAGNERLEIISFAEFTEKARALVYGADLTLIEGFLRSAGTKSFCIVKLLARHETVGVLVVGMLEDAEQVDTEERAMLERLSDAIGVAVDNKLLFEENRRVLRELKRSNTKLKALDEAKDEFISMASHQLRTPLTSVKGYLSMLADGDAGKLNKTQSQFVGQAFASSQRMVYLIADLLNVSRLKTGKFIIEPQPTYLPDVVETEIAQLYESAKARGLSLEFKKPKRFTALMLDEIKIRQVIMNFTDNAMYYTKSGGKITVDLRETPGSVEFTVTDTGIGVPKGEQHKLFTKFYRAGNARKSRPDGTGLGLYMAKKIIVAQGGAIIFKTTEGKGSTFGFSFAKERLGVPKTVGG